MKEKVTKEKDEIKGDSFPIYEDPFRSIGSIPFGKKNWPIGKPEFEK